MSEYNLEARWVKLSEREPERDKEVFARNIKENCISTIEFFDDGPMRYIVGGGDLVIYGDELNEIQEWEWLEFEDQKAATMSEQQATEWGIEARWVNLGEREPNHDDEVFARKTAEDFLTVIYFAEEGDIKYSINGESYIFEDQMDQWEWLELREKGGEE